MQLLGHLPDEERIPQEVREAERMFDELLNTGERIARAIFEEDMEIELVKLGTASSALTSFGLSGRYGVRERGGGLHQHYEVFETRAQALENFRHRVNICCFDPA